MNIRRPRDPNRVSCYSNGGWPTSSEQRGPKRQAVRSLSRGAPRPGWPAARGQRGWAGLVLADVRRLAATMRAIRNTRAGPSKSEPDRLSPDEREGAGGAGLAGKDQLVPRGELVVGDALVQ